MKKLFLLMMFYISTASAGLFPVITAITVHPYSSQQLWVYIDAKPMEIGAASDQVLTMTGYQAGMFNNQNGTARPATSFTSYAVYTKLNETVGQAAMRAYQQTPSGKYDVMPVGGSYCYGYAVVKYSGTNQYSWASTIHPAGCMITPPAQDWCKITTPTLELNHGSITLKNAEGDVASTDVGVDCTSSMAVSFKLTTDDTYVYLAPSGKAQLSINDKPLGSSITLPAGPSTVTLKDMLTGVNTEGVNSGSAVLVMMPY